MYRILTGIIFLIITFSFWAFFTNFQMLLALGNFFIMPLIGLSYFYLRDWRFNEIDLLMLIIFVMASIGDSITVFQKSNFLENIPVMITLFTHIVYMVIFRKQGAKAFIETPKDWLKLILPSLGIFLLFGIYFIPSAPDSIYFILVLYAVQEAILVVLAYFRPVSNDSYYYGIIGVMLLLVSDFTYSFYFFFSDLPILYMVMFLTNILAQLSLVRAIVLCQNKSKENQKKISKEVLVKTVQDFVSSKKVLFSSLMKKIFIKKSSLNKNTHNSYQ